MRFQRDIQSLMQHPKFDAAVRAAMEFQQLCAEMGVFSANDLLMGLPMNTPAAMHHFQQGYLQGQRDEREKAQRALAELLQRENGND